MRQNILFALLGLGLWAAPVLAQNLTATGCVAPTEFQSCQAKAYTCEYQQFAVSFAAYCLSSTSSVPFWPAPAGAADSCSCNLENLYDSVMDSETEGTTCVNKVTDQLLISNPSQASKNDTGCQCCAASGAVSSFYDICPNTNPSLIGLTKIMNYISGLTNEKGFSFCDSTLSTFNCESDLGFPAMPDSGKYYANSNLPASGTQTLYNTNGVLTSPPFGSATTISFATTSYVLTASPYNAANVASGGGATATAGSGAATGTQTGATATTKASGAESRASPSWFGVMLACGALLALV